MMKRPWLAPMLSILFGLLLLMTVEGFLRLVWSPPLLPAEQLAAVAIDPFEITGDTARTKLGYLGAMRSSSFVVPKPEGTLRVFCLGGSTTLGYPYAARFAWPAGLERRLKLLFPTREVEVVNVGGTSYGSARTLAVLRGILKYQPDLVIVATGDAEFVEDSFRVAVRQSVPAVSWLHNLYLSRGLKQVLPGKAASGRIIDAEDQSAAGFLFAPVVAGTVYRVDAERRNTVIAALEKNLHEMAEVAAGTKVPLMLVTLPANVANWPPDPDLSVPEAPELSRRWQQNMARAEGLTGSDNVVDALAEYAAAAKLWNGNATVCYNYGQTLLKAEKFDEARVMLLHALDLDPVPVRAGQIVNRLIRSIASEAEVLLADVVRSLTSLSPHGILDDELILDYAHPTPRGHVEIARVVLQTLGKKGLLGQIDEAQEFAAHRKELDRITQDKPQINAELSFALGQVFERKGITLQAVAMYQQAITQGYQGPFPTFNLARLLALQGRHSEALTLLAPLVIQYPDWQESYGLLGFLHQQLGDANAALGWYRKALQAGDPDPRLYSTVAELELFNGQPEQARDTLAAGLSKNPGNCDLTTSLGRLLEQAGAQSAQAEDFFRKSLADDPTCQLLWENLGLLLMQQQRWQDAEQVFKEALLQAAALAQHHLNLGYVYSKGLHDRAAAVEQFALFLSLVPDGIDLVPAEFRQTVGAGVQ